MSNMKLLKMQCSKTKQTFLLEGIFEGEKYSVINFIDCTDDQSAQILSEDHSGILMVKETLRACQWCGTRQVSGCSCNRSNTACAPKGEYRFQCLFCDKLVRQSLKRDISTLKMSVTEPMYDDIGSILNTLELQYRAFNKVKYDCDILFVNCGTTDNIEPNELRTYVEQGGCLYISDLASAHLEAAFPGCISYSNTGTSGVFKAKISDEDLQSIIGVEFDVTYDLGAWSVVEKHTGSCLIMGSSSPYEGTPMMFHFIHGKGHVFYTSFHNHAQATEKDKSILQVMLIKQIGSVYNTDIKQTSELLGFNISRIKRKIEG